MSNGDWTGWVFWVAIGIVALVVAGVALNRMQEETTEKMTDKSVEIADQLAEAQEQWQAEHEEAAKQTEAGATAHFQN